MLCLQLMTTSLMLGVRLSSGEPSPAAALEAIGFVPADPVLDRHGLRVCDSFDSAASWWVWNADDSSAMYRLADELGPAWCRAFEEACQASMGGIVHLVVAHVGDGGVSRRVEASTCREFRDQVVCWFPAGYVPTESLVITNLPPGVSA